MEFTMTLGHFRHAIYDYVITDCLEAEMLSFLVNEPPDKVKSFVNNLQGMSRVLYNKKVKVKEITPKKDPEYYI